jgi:glycosyltransferase involved in cell wall biosynthesis
MYNGERYLRECIDSILAQTYADFELLLIDDGSTDQTRSIAESYVAADSRVRLAINGQNLGLVGNWNRCIELAQGEWIKFVFQDDAIFPDCLTQMLHAARDGIVFVACQRTLVFDEGTAKPLREAYEVHRALMADLFANDQFLSPERFQRWALERFGVNPLAEPTSVLIHRSAFDTLGWFNPALIMCCDFEMWIRIGIHFGAALAPAELATFRVHKGSTTAANLAFREFRTEILDGLVLLHQYVKDPIYRPVREAARRWSPPIDLKRLFVRRCHEARARAGWAVNDQSSETRSLMAEWRKVTNIYPAISGGSLRHFAWRVKGRLFPALRAPFPRTAREFLK